MGAKIYLCEELDDEEVNVEEKDVKDRNLNEKDVEKVNMTATIVLSRLITWGPDETWSEYAGSLLRDPINLKFITSYLNSVNKSESGKRS